MSAHADLATLVSYWLGELDEAREAEIEQHYLGCDECSGRLAEVEALAAGVRRAFASGRAHAVVTAPFVERLQSLGLRLREYHVPRNGSVNCSVAPEDDVLLSHLQAPLQDVTRLDAIVVTPAEAGGGQFRFEDIPFDPAAGEVVLVPGIERVRALPECREVVRLVAVEAAGDRVIGEYTFNHTPRR